ncbi:MAG: pilus assembly protein [Acidobacteria bacterium]|nr:pilus assembly protein [Acidobacteriota bacterium]
MKIARLRSFGWLKLLWRGDRGSALVETALTVPVVFAMLLGAVEMGDFAFRASEMSNAARAAAQYGAMNGGGFTDCKGVFVGGNCDPTSGMYAAAKKDAPRTFATCTNFTVNATSSCTCSGGAACAAGTPYTCASGNGLPVVNVTVNTSAQCSPVTSVPNLFSGAFSLKGYAQQQVLN